MNYNDGKWHGWNGGGCPVHQETVVEIVLLTCGTEAEIITLKAQCEDWSDIIAFRVIKEHKEPREFWLCKIDDKTTIALDCDGGGCIHVREVIE